MNYRLLFLFFLILSSLTYGQNEQLAQNYFDKGSFEKALVSYEELLKSQPGNGNYFQRVIDCRQQLMQYEKAHVELEERYKKYKQANLLVEIGYNYQLQQELPKATTYYEEALTKIDENPTWVYSIASAFEKKVLLEYALKSYERAVAIDPKSRFNYQMGLLYGQLGKQDLMIEKFLDELYTNPQNGVLIQNQFALFMGNDVDLVFATQLRKALLIRVQKDQDLFWNQMLSWFFVQQKEYGKAFIQEKAIYKREPDSFSNIVNLAELAIEDQAFETAKEIFGFILENTQDIELQIQSHYYLLDMRINEGTSKDYPQIATDLELLLKQYGISPFSLDLQLLQAEFLAFVMKNSEKSKLVLDESLALPLNRFQIARVKMTLADVLLFEEKFNQALLYYSQIEEDLKNDELGHEASLKAAQTSYYKADFEWALVQVKVLKTASTQLIANDALELFLLINDNTVADSTQTALKLFAKGDFLLYQKRNQEALVQFQNILKNHKGEEIEDETLLRIGQTYEKLSNPTEALPYYQQIIDQFPDSIYRDEAFFFSAEIYNLKLQDPEKAKPLYEAVLFNHQDSIYFVDARKKFRQLRGDTNI
ncbi:tetratricopeptide repeat protein [Flavobacterium sp.]|jgi:tetratricopeptide (TPR) repeat protein|uniref:tetratricopeptide repeat protein n=1 Tax=Flavobacterium sp. TaxID=239 RepID=UPI0037BF98C0